MEALSLGSLCAEEQQLLLQFWHFINSGAPEVKSLVSKLNASNMQMKASFAPPTAKPGNAEKDATGHDAEGRSRKMDEPSCRRGSRKRQ